MKPEFYLHRLTGNPVETRDNEHRRASSENNFDKADAFAEQIKFLSRKLIGLWMLINNSWLIRHMFGITKNEFQRKRESFVKSVLSEDNPKKLKIW